METLTAFVSSPEIAAGIVGFGIGVAASTFVSKKSPPKNRFDGRPKYTPGQKPSPPPFLAKGKTNNQVFNPSDLTSAYHLMISSVTPRPIALVSSRSEDGKTDNVAPFSYFGAMAHDPPILSVGFCRKGKDKVQKDSLVNLLGRKEFVVNIMSEWYLDAANHSCGMFAPDVDEFEAAGLTKVEDCQVVKVPRVGEAAVSYECKLEHVYPITNDAGQPTTEIVLARVVRVHVAEQVLVENVDWKKPELDTTKLRPVGRLGGNIYTSLGDIVDIPRPKV